MTTQALPTGVSQRNTNRTSSRNDTGMTLMTQTNDLPTIKPYYQYCSNYQCREIQAIMYAHTPLNPPDTHHINALKTLAKLLGTELHIVCHETKDEHNEQPVILTQTSVAGEVTSRTLSWGEYAVVLRQLQARHEIDNTYCAPPRYDASWLARSKAKGKGDTDLSFSNLLRIIPGVRHLDLDACIYCQHCYQPILIIESSSDGMTGTNLANKQKAVSMSNKIAKTVTATTILLQHDTTYQNQDDTTYLTGWNHNSPRPFTDSQKSTWTHTGKTFKNVTKFHKCNKQADNNKQ